jgi:hypothetical protein
VFSRSASNIDVAFFVQRLRDRPPPPRRERADFTALCDESSLAPRPSPTCVSCAVTRYATSPYSHRSSFSRRLTRRRVTRRPVSVDVPGAMRRLCPPTTTGMRFLCSFTVSTCSVSRRCCSLSPRVPCTRVRHRRRRVPATSPRPPRTAPTNVRLRTKHGGLIVSSHGAAGRSCVGARTRGADIVHDCGALHAAGSARLLHRRRATVSSRRPTTSSGRRSRLQVSVPPDRPLARVCDVEPVERRKRACSPARMSADV